MCFIHRNSLDDFTYNKALQVVVESDRVSPDRSVSSRFVFPLSSNEVALKTELSKSIGLHIYYYTFVSFLLLGSLFMIR